MNFSVVTKRSDVAKAARVLGLVIKRGTPFHRALGHQGDSWKQTVYWHVDAGIWGVQRRESNRFWQAFGLKAPQTWTMSSIVVEINPPLAGINRHTGGVFLIRDSVTFLGHRANVINQVPKEDFRKRFPEGRAGRWVTVVDGDTENDVLVLGRIDRRDIMTAIGHFTREVKRIKKIVRPDMKSTG
jgi:hypothetical protein